MAGGMTLVSCSDDLFADLVDETGPLEDISIEEAKSWFEGDYLPNLRLNQRPAAGGKSHKRKAAWERAQKPENAAKKEYVWVPVDYEDDARPGIVIYDEDTKFKKELSKYYLQPVIEGLIVIKSGKKNRAFLAQIAYDMQEMAANNFVLEKSKFTGTLLKVDWDDNLINGLTYEKGTPLKGFKNLSDVDESNGRAAGCDYTLLSSVNSYYVNSVGEVVIVVHNTWSGGCDGSGSGSSNGGFNYFGNGSYGGGGGNGTGPGTSGYYDPLVHSDAGNITYPPPISQIYNFNLPVAIREPGADRTIMNNNLKETLYAINMIAGIQGMTWDKASALAKSIGGNVDNFTPTFVVLGKTFNTISVTFGVAGVVTSLPGVIIGFTDGNISNEDWRAAGAVIATGVGIWAGGWIAVGLGAVSLGIAIYDHP